MMKPCEIQKVKLSELKPSDYNPRTISTEALAGLSASIERFGMVQPIVWNKRTGNVVGGHQRLKVLLEKGIAETDVVVVDLDDNDEVALNVTLNNPTIQGEFIKETGGLLRSLEGQLGDAFKELRLDDLRESLAGLLGKKDSSDVSSTKPQIDRAIELNKKWQVKAGDLWSIGTHRLLCGDCTKKEDMERVLNGEKANAAVTDPPYGVGYAYDVCDDTLEKWYVLMDTVVPMLRAAAPFVVMPSCSINRLDWWYAHHKPDWLLCWYKGSPGHNSFVGFNDWEPHLVWGKPPKPMHDYWQLPSGYNIAPHRGSAPSKPVEYALWLVERACEKSDIVYEPFCGSGTTMVACENLGRKCYAIELSANYCAVVLERMTTAFPQLKIELQAGA